MILLYGIGLLTTYFYMSGCGDRSDLTREAYINNLKTLGPIGGGIGGLVAVAPNTDLSLNKFPILLLSGGLGHFGTALQKTLYPDQSGIFRGLFSGAIGAAIAAPTSWIQDSPNLNGISGYGITVGSIVGDALNSIFGLEKLWIGE